jgi:hypothetical protein
MNIDGKPVNYPVKATSINIECCPGQQLGDRTCNTDFKWVIIEPEEIECFSDAQCPGQNTQWLTSADDILTQNTYGCENGNCEITDTRSTECNELVACQEGVCKEGKCIIEDAGIIDLEEACDESGGTWVQERDSTGRLIKEFCDTPFDFTPLIILLVGIILGLVTIVWGVKTNWGRN